MDNADTDEHGGLPEGTEQGGGGAVPAVLPVLPLDAPPDIKRNF